MGTGKMRVAAGLCLAVVAVVLQAAVAEQMTPKMKAKLQATMDHYGKYKEDTNIDVQMHRGFATLITDLQGRYDKMKDKDTTEGMKQATVINAMEISRAEACRKVMKMPPMEQK